MLIRLLVLLSGLSVMLAPSAVLANQAGGLPALAARVAVLEAERADFLARLEALENLTQHFSLVDVDPLVADTLGNPDETLRISGVNLQVVNDTGTTDGTPNALGDPQGVAVDDNFIYWTDANEKQILRGAIDGSGSATLLFGVADYPDFPNILGSPRFIAIIPEPSTLTLAGIGLIGLLAYGWRRRRRV